MRHGRRKARSGRRRQAGNSPAHNLPGALSTFIGRGSESAIVGRAVRAEFTLAAEVCEAVAEVCRRCWSWRRGGCEA